MTAFFWPLTADSLLALQKTPLRAGNPLFRQNCCIVWRTAYAQEGRKTQISRRPRRRRARRQAASPSRPAGAGRVGRGGPFQSFEFQRSMAQQTGFAIATLLLVRAVYGATSDSGLRPRRRRGAWWWRRRRAASGLRCHHHGQPQFWGRLPTGKTSARKPTGRIRGFCCATGASARSQRAHVRPGL